MTTSAAILCRRCGKIFPGRLFGSGRQKMYCSVKCSGENAKQWKTCVWCGKEYHAAKKTIMCRWCRAKFPHVKSPGPLVLCVTCGQVKIRTEDARGNYCSGECQAKDNNRRKRNNAHVRGTVRLTCPECLNTFDYDGVEHKSRKYCSRRCAYRSRKKRQPQRRQVYRRTAHIFDVYIKCLGKCHLCGRPVRLDLIDQPMASGAPTIDHVLPISRGGDWSIENLLLAHRKCNVAKNNKGNVQRMLC